MGNRIIRTCPLEVRVMSIINNNEKGENSPAMDWVLQEAEVQERVEVTYWKQCLRK